MPHLGCCVHVLLALRPSTAAAAAAESGDSDSEGGGKGNNAARREPVPALDEIDGSRQPPADDEVERVLGHRWEGAGALGSCLIYAWLQKYPVA